MKKNRIVGIETEGGLTIRSKGRLKLPPVCAHCGTATRSKLHLDVHPGDGVSELTNAIGIGFHRTVAIPCCRKCKRHNTKGMLMALACLAAAGLLGWLSIAIVDHVPVLVVSIMWFLVVMLGMGGVIFCSIKGQERAMPAYVTCDTKGIYSYRFYGGIFQDWAEGFMK
jgi:hypothetical protein